MTSLLTRPAPSEHRPPAESARPRVDAAAGISGALAAGAVGVGSLVVCMATALAGWLAADAGSFTTAASVGALAWAVGNGGGLTGGAVAVSAVPLGLWLAFGFALHRAGRWLAGTGRARSPQDVAVATAAFAGGYAALGAVVGVFVRVGDVHAGALRTTAACAATAAVWGGAGLASGSGLVTATLDRLPVEVRAAAGGGVAGALALLGAGAFALAVSLAVHVGAAIRLAEGLHAGLVGGAILTLVGMALLPNAVLCSGAFLAGPGFAVGQGTSVAPGSVRLGTLPDFPLLAAIPERATAFWMPSLVVVPVLAGAVAGFVALRRHPATGVDRAALRGGLAGLAGGVGFGLLTTAATGGFGRGRLGAVGPDVVATTAVCAVGCALGGVLVALASAVTQSLRDQRGARLPGLLPRTAVGSSTDAQDATDEPDAEATVPIPRAGDAG